MQINTQKDINSSRSPELSGSNLINLTKEQGLDHNKSEHSIHQSINKENLKAKSSSKAILSNATKNYFSKKKPEKEQRNSQKNQFLNNIRVKNHSMKGLEKNDDKFIYLVSPDSNSNIQRHKSKSGNDKDFNNYLNPKSKPQSIVSQNLLNLMSKNISNSQIEKMQSPIGRFSLTYQNSENYNGSENGNRSNSNSRKSRSDDKMSKLLSPILRNKSPNQTNFFNEGIGEFSARDKVAQEDLTKDENEEDSINFHYSKDNEKEMGLQGEADFRGVMLHHLDNYNEQVLIILNQKLAQTLDLEMINIENKLREEVYDNIKTMLEKNLHIAMEKKDADYLIEEIDQCLIPHQKESNYVNVQELDSNLSNQISEQITSSINYKNDFHLQLSSSLIKNVRTIFNNVNEIIQKHLQQKVPSISESLSRDTILIFEALFTQLSAKARVDEEILQDIQNENLKNLSSRNSEFDIKKSNSVSQSPRIDIIPKSKSYYNELKRGHLNENLILPEIDIIKGNNTTKSVVEKTISKISKSLTLFDVFIEKKKLNLAKQSKNFEEEMNKLTKTSSMKQEIINNAFNNIENDEKKEFKKPETRPKISLNINLTENQNYEQEKSIERSQQSLLRQKINALKFNATDKKKDKRILTAVTEQSEISIDDPYSKKGPSSSKDSELRNEKLLSAFSANNLKGGLPIYNVYDEASRKKSLTNITEFSSPKDSSRYSPLVESIHFYNDQYEQEINEEDNDSIMQYGNIEQREEVIDIVNDKLKSKMTNERFYSNADHKNPRFVNRRTHENVPENSGASPKSNDRWLSMY